MQTDTATKDDPVIEIEGELLDPDTSTGSEEKKVGFAGDFTGIIIESGENSSLITGIKRGYETINTNGPVFCPTEAPPGSLVRFSELIAVPTQNNAFRFSTKSIEIVEHSTALVKQDGYLLPEATIRLTRAMESPYHLKYKAKFVEPEKLQKAAENGPFHEIIDQVIRMEEDDKDSLASRWEDYLEDEFPTLKDIGVSYSIRGVDAEEEDKTVKKVVENYSKHGQAGIGEAIQETYTRLLPQRNALTFMYEEDVLRPDSVIPVKYLPEALVTAPVKFVWHEGLEDLTKKTNPPFDVSTEFICDLVGSKQFAWLYQIYNRRARPFSQFKGDDYTRPETLELIERAKKMFDFLSIDTPYLDVLQWKDEFHTWPRNPDPFFFGYKKDVPFFFLLDRWSATGLFPHLCDMIADTMEHLKAKKDELCNFAQDSFWYKGGRNGRYSTGFLGLKGYPMSVLENSDSSSRNTVLVSFADQVLAAYEHGKLFEFLRDEYKPEPKKQ